MKRKDILILLIPSFIIVILWVIFSVFHSFVTSTIPESLNMQIMPINPNFDQKTIENIKQRDVVEPIYSASVSPTETPAPEISPTQNLATSGGSLQ